MEHFSSNKQVILIQTNVSTVALVRDNYIILEFDSCHAIVKLGSFLSINVMKYEYRMLGQQN